MAGNYNLGTASGKILVDGGGAEIGFGIAKGAAKEFFDAVEAQLKALKEFGQDMMKAGAVGAAGFVIAGNSAAAFEQRLSAVRAVSGATEDQMRRISDAALQIGQDTSFSATEAASAFEELVKAGISVDQALDGAALATANLAAAGEIALPRAAEIAANAMNNFNLAGKDMPHIADLVAGAANASAISVEEFAQSMSQVGAVASLVGISFDDTAVAIAEMGNAGIKGSDAGTSLKTMLLNLQPTMQGQITKFKELGLITYDAADAMKSLAAKGITPVSDSFQDVRGAISDYLEETQGIKDDTKEMGKAVDDWLMKNAGMQNAFFDSTGKAKSLGEMQKILANATKDLTEEQKLASLELMFGADAIRAAAIMSKEGEKGFNDMATAMGNVTAAGTAEVRLDNVRGSLEKLKGAFETLLIQLGTIFLPVVKRVVDGLTEFVEWLSSASERAKTFFVSLGGIGTALALVGGALITTLAVLGPFLIQLAGAAMIQKLFRAGAGAVKYFASILAASSGPITFFMRLQARITTLFTGISAAAATAAGAVGLFGRILAIAMSGWGILAAVVALLVAVGVVLYNTWQPFTDLIDGIAAAIGGVLTAAVNVLQIGIGKLVDGFNGVQAAGDPVSQLLSGLGAVAAVVWADMQRLGDLFMTTVVPALQELWGILQSAFGDAFAQIAAVVQSDLLPALQTLGDAFVNDLFPALQQVGEFLLPIIGFVLQVAGALIGGFYTALITVASVLIGTVLPAIIQFAGPVLGFLISAIAAIAGFVIQYLITPFVGFITFLVGTVIPAVIAFGSMLFGAIGSAFAFVGDVISNVVGWISGFVSAIVNFFTGAGQAAESGVSGFQSVLNGVVGFFAGIVGAIGAWMTSIFTTVVNGWNAVLAFISPVTNVLGEIFGAMWGVVAAIVNGVVGLVLAVVQFLWGTMVLYFQTQSAILMGHWNNFWATFNAVIAAFVAVITQAWNAFWMGLMVIIQPFIDWFTVVIPAAWAVVQAAIAQGQQVISDVVSGAWNGLMSLIGNIVTVIQTLVAVGWNNLVRNIQNAMNLARSILEGIWNFIRNLFQSAVNYLDSVTGGGFSRMVSTVQAVLAGWVSMISGKINEVRGFFDRLPATIQAIFAGAGNWLANAGRQIIDGLLSGLRGAAGAITDFFAGITASIPQIKGPPEHDKVMLIPAGKMIMHSLWRGLDDGKDAVYDLLNNMNATIPATLDAILDPNLQSTIDGTLSGKASFTTINKAPIVNVEPAQVTMRYDAKLYLGDKDITDMVDMRVEEHFDGASSLISTGVND
jgi:phage-related protein